MCRKHFVEELSRRTNVAPEKAEEAMDAILEILAEWWDADEPVYLEGGTCLMMNPTEQNFVLWSM